MKDCTALILKVSYDGDGLDFRYFSTERPHLRVGRPEVLRSCWSSMISLTVTQTSVLVLTRRKKGESLGNSHVEEKPS